MQKQLLSHKLTLIIGLLIILINFIYTSTTYSKKNTVVICNEKSGMTIVIISDDQSLVVAGESDPKDLLSCIGKSSPFYSREINYLISSSRRNHQTLEDRYKILDREMLDTKGILTFYDNIYMINKDGSHILVGAKPQVSPFILEKYLSKEEHAIVYMPENTPNVDALLGNMIERKGGEFYTLKIGENAVLPLF